MPSFDPSITLHLRDGEMLRCDERRDHWLSVVRGRVWVTSCGDLDDHFLDSGQAMRLPAGCKALVSAEGAAQVVVAAALAARSRATIGLPLPHLRPRP